MRILAAIVLVIISPVPMVILTLSAVSTDPPPGATSILLLVIGGLLLMLLPILAGAMTAQWEQGVFSARGRTRHPVAFRGLSGLGVIGVLAIIGSSVIGRIPPWIPLIAIVVEALITLLAVRMGGWVRRRSAERLMGVPAEPDVLDGRTLSAADTARAKAAAEKPRNEDLPPPRYGERL